MRDLTQKDLDQLLQIGLEKLKAYKSKGYTALQLINGKKFPEKFIRKHYETV